MGFKHERAESGHRKSIGGEKIESEYLSVWQIFHMRIIMKFYIKFA